MSSHLNLVRFMLGQAAIFLDEEIAEETKNKASTAELKNLSGIKSVIESIPGLILEHMQDKASGHFDSVAVGAQVAKPASESVAHVRLKSAAKWIEDNRAAQIAAQVAQGDSGQESNGKGQNDK